MRRIVKTRIKKISEKSFFIGRKWKIVNRLHRRNRRGLCQQKYIIWMKKTSSRLYEHRPTTALRILNSYALRVRPKIRSSIANPILYPGSSAVLPLYHGQSSLAQPFQIYASLDRRKFAKSHPRYSANTTLPDTWSQRVRILWPQLHGHLASTTH